MKHKILIIILFIANQLIIAQNGQPGGMNRENMPSDGVIKAQVIDSETKNPVKFANAALFSMRDSSVVAGVVSDENGFFEMTGLKYGRFYLIVDFIGYFKETLNDIKINPANKELNLGEIILKQSVENIEEVEIIGERNLVEYKIDRKVINISKNINAAGGTLVDALENAPSIKVDIDGNVSMRGSSNFTVLIDGKPSVLDANDILQQIPASSVENVEIITNPSVKYDPDGTTGILNIIMKKETVSGFNGIINASIGTGDKYSTDFLINYRTKKVNYNFSANYGDRTHFSTETSLRKTFYADTTEFLESITENSHQRNNYSVSGSADINFNNKNSLSVGGQYGFYGFGMETVSDIKNYTLPETFNSYNLNIGTNDVGGNFFSANIDFTHSFSKKGHQLVFSSRYSGRTGGVESSVTENQTEADFATILLTDKYRTFQDRGNTGFDIKADYTLPINENLKFEAGYQSRFRDASGDYIKENYIDSEWKKDETYSNELNFIRNIHSIYSSLSGKKFGIQYMIGLRGEYTDRLLEQITSGESYPVKRLDYFPSVHLTKEFNKEQQVQASYSKRVERPKYWYLNPFPGYTDAYSVRVGNPALLPEYIDSYELSYNRRINKSYFNIEAYYRQTNNKINRIQELLPDGRILNTFDNFDKEFAYGTEISGNFQIAKWMILYANANVYNYNLEGETAGESTNVNSTNYDFRLNSTVMFSKSTRLQLDGVYDAPTVTTQGTREGFYYFGAAFKQDFFDKRISVVVRVNDIFKTGKQITDSEGDGFSFHQEELREAPVFNLSLSYKINNYKQEKKERNGEMNDMDEGMM
jgi:outer membrane receptor protein involved in Fe transport